jgi:hypothetical protein
MQRRRELRLAAPVCNAGRKAPYGILAVSRARVPIPIEE